MVPRGAVSLAKAPAGISAQRQSALAISLDFMGGFVWVDEAPPAEGREGGDQCMKG